VLFGADLTTFVREGNTRGLFEKRTVASLLTGEPEYLIPLGEETPEGWIVTGYPWDQITDAPHKAFIDAYRAKFNDTPRLGSFLGYSVGYMMRDLLEKAGSTDTEKLIATLKGDFKFTSVAGTGGDPRTRPAIDHGRLGRRDDQAGQGGRHEELEVRGRLRSTCSRKPR
jgi:branched-chain amino acid transport system substrate-binding protein